LLSTKSISAKNRWYANQAKADLEIHRRVHDNINNDGVTSHPFRYFDGATMKTYQFPDRITENKYCLTQPQPKECIFGHGYDPANVEHTLAVQTSLSIQAISILPSTMEAMLSMSRSHVIPQLDFVLESIHHSEGSMFVMMDGTTNSMEVSHHIDANQTNSTNRVIISSAGDLVYNPFLDRNQLSHLHYIHSSQLR
jgi:hypothetical protein